jgi:hypothetical protein
MSSTIKPGKPKKISAKELDTLLFNDWTGDILPDWYTRLPHHSPSEPVWRKIPRELYFALESVRSDIYGGWLTVESAKDDEMNYIPRHTCPAIFKRILDVDSEL